MEGEKEPRDEEMEDDDEEEEEEEEEEESEDSDDDYRRRRRRRPAGMPMDDAVAIFDELEATAAAVDVKAGSRIYDAQAVVDRILNREVTLWDCYAYGAEKEAAVREILENEGKHEAECQTDAPMTEDEYRYELEKHKLLNAGSGGGSAFLTQSVGVAEEGAKGAWGRIRGLTKKSGQPARVKDLAHMLLSMKDTAERLREVVNPLGESIQAVAAAANKHFPALPVCNHPEDLPEFLESVQMLFEVLFKTIMDSAAASVQEATLPPRPARVSEERFALPSALLDPPTPTDPSQPEHADSDGPGLPTVAPMTHVGPQATLTVVTDPLIQSTISQEVPSPLPPGGDALPLRSSPSNVNSRQATPTAGRSPSLRNVSGSESTDAAHWKAEKGDLPLRVKRVIQAKFEAALKTEMDLRLRRYEESLKERLKQQEDSARRRTLTSDNLAASSQYLTSPQASPPSKRLRRTRSGASDVSDDAADPPSGRRRRKGEKRKKNRVVKDDASSGGDSAASTGSSPTNKKGRKKKPKQEEPHDSPWSASDIGEASLPQEPQPLPRRNGPRAQAKQLSGSQEPAADKSSGGGGFELAPTDEAKPPEKPKEPSPSPPRGPKKPHLTSPMNAPPARNEAYNLAQNLRRQRQEQLAGAADLGGIMGIGGTGVGSPAIAPLDGDPKAAGRQKPPPAGMEPRSPPPRNPRAGLKRPPPATPPVRPRTPIDTFVLGQTKASPLASPLVVDDIAAAKSKMDDWFFPPLKGATEGAAHQQAAETSLTGHPFAINAGAGSKPTKDSKPAAKTRAAPPPKPPASDGRAPRHAPAASDRPAPQAAPGLGAPRVTKVGKVGGAKETKGKKLEERLHEVEKEMHGAVDLGVRSPGIVPLGTKRRETLLHTTPTPGMHELQA
eukprot:TRINITY_DN8016_c0_g2_i1.p1 TRINITY_DN8016_c0_g2~~TRINITY_DN8016_c0_g2_i1.p1  ORF type:complete len:925 (+),score=326.75 TRINITY_DN8016_c0_g2_i1:88-2775(+)